MAKKKVQDQGAQIPRNAAYIGVREISREAAQHRYWTFYEAIKFRFSLSVFTRLSPSPFFLTTDTDHLAIDGVGVKFAGMLEGLSFDGTEKNIGQFGIQAAGPKGGFNILMDIGQKAGPYTSIRGKPQPIAFITKMAAYRTDEADFTDGPLEFVAHGRTVMGGSGNRKQFAQSFKPASDLGVKKGGLVAEPGMADGHILNETDMKRVLKREGRQVGQLIIIYSV